MSNRKNNTTVVLIGIVLFMLALSFASVPIYRIFCQRTGYGGTTQFALYNNSKIKHRTINVRFNADVNGDLPWRFCSLQQSLKVRLGETSLAFYQVQNISNKIITGIAVYNVTPDKVGVYFNKLHCFCFEEQSINAQNTVNMPVQFFLDSQMANDPNCDDVKEITLSYTFFNAKDPNIPKILGLPNPQRHRMQKFLDS